MKRDGNKNAALYVCQVNFLSSICSCNSTILFCNNWIWLGHGGILSHIMIYPREKQNKKTKVYCGNEWTVVIKKVEGKRIVC